MAKKNFDDKSKKVELGRLIAKCRGNSFASFSLLTAYQILIAVKETSELSCLTIRMFQISVFIVHFVYSFREY